MAYKSGHPDDGYSLNRLHTPPCARFSVGEMNFSAGFHSLLQKCEVFGSLPMSKAGAIITALLCCSPLCAQDGQVLPDEGPPPFVDIITPVPAPEIPLGSLGLIGPAVPQELEIDNQGGSISGDLTTGILTLGGPIKVQGDNGLQIFSDTATIDTKAKIAILEGNVSIYQGNLLQRGDRTVYNYGTKSLETQGLRASLDPILLESGKFTAEERDGKQVFVGTDAGITTHDVEHPNYWVRAKKTTIYPGEKVVFNNLSLYAGDTPVFWLPYLSQPLDAELGYHFMPGAKSAWGPYLLNTYGIMLGGNYNSETGENEDAWLLSRWRVDLLSRRGIGTGIDLVDTREEPIPEITGLSAYFINDLAPDTTRSGIRRGFVNEDRYKVELKYRNELELKSDAKWRLDTNLTFLSDPYYLQDFDPDSFRVDPAPDNTIGLYRRDDASLFSIYARYQLNNFYRTDTRLPEVSFDKARAPLFGLPVLHEGSTSLGLIGERAAQQTQRAVVNPLFKLSAGDAAVPRLLRELSGYERRLAVSMISLPLGDSRREAIRSQLLDPSYARFTTYQEVSLPLTLANSINFTPQAGIGYNRYNVVDGPIGNSDQTYLHVGAETSVKFSKNIGDYTDASLGLDGINHVFQPYSNWSIISTNSLDPFNPRVDRLTPTTRPRPLDPNRFIAVDELQSWNVARLGTRNRLFTQRDNQSFEWLYMDTFIDVFINDPEGDREFSNLYNEVRWKPVPWLDVGLETQFPIFIGGSGFVEFNTDFRFLPTDDLEFSIGYRNLSNHPVLIDSSRIETKIYHRLNEDWGIGMQHSYELADGTLEFEQYSLHRDLGNWVAGVGLSHRDNRLEQEYAIVFSLTLKDFPTNTLPFNIDGR